MAWIARSLMSNGDSLDWPVPVADPESLNQQQATIATEDFLNSQRFVQIDDGLIVNTDGIIRVMVIRADA
jgi:hypothetical protein